MDMQMPVMDGLSALKALRQRGDNTPVIVLTANSVLEDRVLAQQAGCNDFISKPFKLEEFNPRIAKYVKPARVAATVVPWAGCPCAAEAMDGRELPCQYAIKKPYNN